MNLNKLKQKVKGVAAAAVFLASYLASGCIGETALAASQVNLGARIVANAMPLLGTKYVWGGKGNYGSYDCSGLVQQALVASGVSSINSAAIPGYTAAWESLLAGKNVGDTISVQYSDGSVSEMKVVLKDSTEAGHEADISAPGTILLYQGHIGFSLGNFYPGGSVETLKQQLINAYGGLVAGDLRSMLDRTSEATGEPVVSIPNGGQSVYRIHSYGTSSNGDTNPGRGVSIDNGDFSTKNGSALVLYALAPTTTKVKISLQKTSAETGQPLANAVFGVFSDAGCTNLVTQMTTGADGTAVSSELEEGTYYLVELQAPAGYVKSATVYPVNAVGTVVNVAVEPNHLEKTEISVTKQWEDAGNQDGMRPTSIHVHLMNGSTEVASADLSAENGWSYTFVGLQKYDASGNLLSYQITEDPVEGYQTQINGTTIINTHVTETTEISGIKTWKDQDNNDGIRPAQITVYAMDGEQVAGSAIASVETNWKYTITGLPKYRNGQLIAYTVSEEPVPGYDMAVKGNNLENSHTPETTQVSGSKLWEDADNQDGMRPDQVTVRLMDGDQEIASQIVTAENGWNYVFTGLPKYRAGVEIAYHVIEDAVTGYETHYDGWNITNVHVPEVTEVSGEKTWNDADNQDGIRPTSVHIYVKNGDTVVAETDATEKNGWKYSVKGLPKYEHGKKITYTVEEASVEGYQTQVNGTKITNVHEPEQISISGIKTWNDEQNNTLRPESIVVRLMEGSKEITRQTVSADDDGNWSYTFSNLPKYRSGNAISYHVEEEIVDGYVASYDGMNIRNTAKAGQVRVEKVDAETKNPVNSTYLLYVDAEGKTPAYACVSQDDVTLTDKQATVVLQDGTGESDFVPFGTYYLREDPQAVPVGYILDEAVYGPVETGCTLETPTVSVLEERQKIALTVMKVDRERKTPLSGAVFDLYAAEDILSPDQVTVRFVKGTLIGDLVTDETGKARLEDLYAGQYTLVEIQAPDGYQLNTEAMKVVLDYSQDTAQVMVEATATAEDDTTLIEFSKQDVAGAELAGAKLQITDLDGNEVTDVYGNVIESWVSDLTIHVVRGMKDGSYLLTETMAPDGYQISESVAFEIKHGVISESENNRVVMKNAYSKVDFSKQDVAGDELEGAMLQITDLEGNPVFDIKGNEIEAWISDGTTHIVEGICNGDYLLTEISAPNGYICSESIAFTVEDGLVKAGIVTMTDEYSKVLIKKTDFAGEELPGAELVVVRMEDETVMDNWISDGTAHVIEGLLDGIYELRETKAPDGYVVTETMAFEIKEGHVVDVEDETLVMKDDVSRIYVRKTDLAGEELPGATLTVTKNSDGQIIDRWVSDGTAHMIEGLLDGIYTLTEVASPDGYTVAEEITFEIKEGYLVSDGDTITMADELSKVWIRKTDVAGKELPGATLTVTRDSDGQIMDRWVSGGTDHIIEGLLDGTYTLTEETAPEGYQKAESIRFELKAGQVVGHEEGKITMIDHPEKTPDTPILGISNHKVVVGGSFVALGVVLLAYLTIRSRRKRG